MMKCKTDGCNNDGVSNGAGKRPKKLCTACQKAYKFKYPVYHIYKGNSCDYCGFVAIHSCQLDVDHLDGNKQNASRDNLQTLCANCHRLKTQLSKDYL